MQLHEALRFQRGWSVAFTGAGGKSSAMARLAAELSVDSPVIVTSTTKLALHQTDMANHHMVLRRGSDILPLSGLIEENRSVLVTGPSAENEPKWLGLGPEMMVALRKLADRSRATLLIEADGARGRSLKAPDDHEPVIPAFTDLVLNVVGMDVIGQRVDSALVHRPERVAGVLGIAARDPITTGHVAALITSPQGGLKGVPAIAEFHALLNKIDVPGGRDNAQLTASALLSSPRLRSGVLGSMRDDRPVWRVYGRIAGVVLAAGGSRRMGKVKQLILWKGKPLVWHVVSAALESGLTSIVVVLGAEADSIRGALDGLPVEFVVNPDWEAGQSTSVRRGLEAVIGNVEGAMFLLADMPKIRASLLDSLIEFHRRTLTPIIAPRAAGRWGNPVLFDKTTFDGLAQLTGDRGGRALFDSYRVGGIDTDESVLFDVDNPGDMRKLMDST
jgi:molybdenum cofactor cytidylyltransferase